MDYSGIEKWHKKKKVKIKKVKMRDSFSTFIYSKIVKEACFSFSTENDRCWFNWLLIENESDSVDNVG